MRLLAFKREAACWLLDRKIGTVSSHGLVLEHPTAKPHPCVLNPGFAKPPLRPG